MMILRPGNGLEEFGAYELTPNSFFITIQKEVSAKLNGVVKKNA